MPVSGNVVVHNIQMYIYSVGAIHLFFAVKQPGVFFFFSPIDNSLIQDFLLLSGWQGSLTEDPKQPSIRHFENVEQSPSQQVTSRTFTKVAFSIPGADSPSSKHQRRSQEGCICEGKGEDLSNLNWVKDLHDLLLFMVAKLAICVT